MSEKQIQRFYPTRRSVVTGLESPVFYDCEASSLEGLPIEIGWAFLDRQTGQIQSEGHLIKPPSNWDLRAHWNPGAQALHGITIEQLMAHGRPPSEIANRMNAALVGAELFSDDPLDVVWLGHLLKAAGCDPEFTICRTDANVLMAQVAQKLEWNTTRYEAAKEEANRLAPHIHRAEADARNLAVFWQIVISDDQNLNKHIPRPRSNNGSGSA
jgi:hypothetical protein